MATFKQFLLLDEAPTDQQVAEQAAAFVKTATLSSKGVQLPPQQVIDFLRQTVQSAPYKLYRGIGLIRQRIPEQYKEEIKRLQVGDQLPEFLQGDDNTILHCTKKKSVARHYAEGTVELIAEINPDSSQIIVDLANLHKIIPADLGLLDRHDYDYFKRDKEVLIRGPAQGILLGVNTTGRL